MAKAKKKAAPKKKRYTLAEKLAGKPRKDQVARAEKAAMKKKRKK